MSTGVALAYAANSEISAHWNQTGWFSNSRITTEK